MQPDFRLILATLAQAVQRPKFKKKQNGARPFTQIPDMIHASGYAEGALDVLSVLHDKDPNKGFKF